MSFSRRLQELGVGVINSLGDVPRRELNRAVINRFATSTEPRPRAFSLWSPIRVPEPETPSWEVPDYTLDYTSWPGLVDRKYSGRHLPPADASYVRSLPVDAKYEEDERHNVTKLGDVTKLFARPERMLASRSSALFMFFAQWFTDSLLRTHPVDRRQNTSNHDIDLCQIYGLRETTTRLLRAHRDGLMLTQLIDGQEFLPYLCEPDGKGDFRVRDEFDRLPASQTKLDKVLNEFADLKPSRKEKLYATGLERGNQSVGYVALSTVFVREHNRLARGLKARHPSWNDERLFQTARVINIVIEMKLVVEEYINHILGMDVFRLDHTFAETQHWYRANWMAVEFDLLYRWHGLAPDSIKVGDETLSPVVFRNNNKLLEQVGVGAIIDAASRQRAGKIGLGNTPWYLWKAEYEAIKMGRDFRLQSYNAYRRHFKLDPLESFDQLTSDRHVVEELQRLYDNDIERLEYQVGLFAEEAEDGLLFGELMNTMVAYDAFTQIFSNPLLSKNVYGERTFTEWGLEQIEGTTSLQQVVDRNIGPGFKACLGIAHSEPTLAIDADLGEVRGEDEEDVSREIAEIIRTKLELAHDAKGGIVPRDAHAKAHGCVRAVFHVDADLPEALQKGAFQRDKRYDAWIRFSNGDADRTRADGEGDSRGMAIKLLGVPGKKILPEEEDATTQDFLLINHPRFIVDKPSRYLSLMQGSNSSSAALRALSPFALGIKGMLIARKITSSTIASPLETQYFSATAYRLGTGSDRVAVKYSVRPLGYRPSEEEIPDGAPPNFLRERLITRLADAECVLEFLVQVRSSPEMSVERATEEWEEKDAPFQRVALITIPKQVFATPKQDAYGERLSFTPWHSLPEHQPLGAMNRVRRVVYDEVSRFRHHVGGHQRSEPEEMVTFE